MLSILTTVLAFFLGGLPTGYAVGRLLRGLDIRRYSAHNLGVGTVAAAAGPHTLALATALDLIKGGLAVALARLLGGGDWTMAASAAAVAAGHAYSPFWFLVPSATVRVKGVVVAAGAFLGLAILGVVPWAALAVPAVVALAALGVPRVAGRRWGYLSLATVLATASLPAALWALGGRSPYLALGLTFAIVSLWNHKEHLARIADGTEPRMDERLPLPMLPGDDAVCAFLVHPMTVDDNWEAGRFRWLMPLRRRGMISDAVVRRTVRFARPMKVDDIHPIITADGKRARVYLIGVPLLPDQIRLHPGLAVRRAVQAAHLAENLGATVLGLGAYWSVVGNKGTEVAARSGIAITNGGAYTAATVKMAVPLILDRLRSRGVDPADATIAVVGANGVVGFGICRQVVGHVGRLIMLGTDASRLERSRELLARRHPGAHIETTTVYGALREADAIFTATSSPHPIIFPEHVREGCLIIDLGRPYDVEDSVKAMPGVEVIPGGVVRLPGNPSWNINLGYGPGLVPACLAETVIIALDGCTQRVSLGDRTKTENIEYLAVRAAEMGFEVVAKADGRNGDDQGAGA